MPVEIARVQSEELADFERLHEREALRSFYAFHVVWHEQLHGFAARDGGQTVGMARIRIAASLAHIEALIVAPERRREGIGRKLLENAADVAGYYNSHKMTVMVPHRGEAQQFFVACDYHEEAVLPQHTFKLDMAVLRRFLL